MNRSIFQIWGPNVPRDITNNKNIKTMNINFGPQHPAAHGVLRLILQLNGEIVEKADPHIGLLHRGSEKLIEDRFYLQSLPYFDRFDYCSMLVQEHAYCLAIESLLGTNNYSSTCSQIRTLYDELTRILNHMLAIACHALDVGSMSSIFWAFEEREKIMEFYERVSGARMHAAFYRPNDTNLDSVSSFLIEDILDFTRNCFTTLNEMHNILTFNKIWKHRLVNIGVINYQTCLDYGLTGVMSRSVGIKRDLRLSKLETYSNYYFLNFRSFLGQHGDSYDRFLIRMNEMAESLNIINQVIYKIIKHKKNSTKFTKNSTKFTKNSTKFTKNSTKFTKNSTKFTKNSTKFTKNSTKFTKNSTKNKNFFFYTNINPHNIIRYTNPEFWNKYNSPNGYNSMEDLIKHFKHWSEGDKIKSNWTYQSVESPKGEFGVSLVSNNTGVPYRCKVRSPAYHNMHVLPQISKGHFLADLVALIGTIDVVFGEVDR